MKKNLDRVFFKITSSRFIAFIIASILVYIKAIDPMQWLVIACAYIGLKTADKFIKKDE